MTNIKKQKRRSANSPNRVSVIEAVKTPLGFFTLIVLVTEALIGTLVAAGRLTDGGWIWAMITLIFLLVIVVAVMAYFRPETLYSLATRPPRSAPAPTATMVEERLATAVGIVGEEKPAPSAGVWYRDIRPVLHQAIHYTVPTYYLDVNLMVVDWNIAFDLVFSRLGAKLRNKHVKHFIAELENFDQVMDHAQEFTRQVLDGRIPFVDVETLRYSSERFGEVSFLKLATQLHDPEGRPRGWSVSLIIRDIDWTSFEKELLEETSKDKLWSVYSASYDRVLLRYPPYRKLIQDVTSVVSSRRQCVLDLGAGTGNVTATLLEAGHAVTAVESNLGMLDRLRSKSLQGGRQPIVVKSSIESLATFNDESFDAAVMVNALYAVSDPLACLQGVCRILRKNGVFGLSTTHSLIDLDPLLRNIKARLMETGCYEELSGDYEILYDVNKQIEKDIARRYTSEQYREWICAAGFEITKDVPSTYDGAVMLIHARKK